MGDDAENSGGLRVRLTVTFTASRLAAPPYMAISRLSESELSVEKCPDGILAVEIPNFCQGGDDLFNNGSGWLVFLRADKKDKTTNDNNGETNLSIAKKKFIDNNDEVLLPFIKSSRQKLG